MMESYMDSSIKGRISSISIVQFMACIKDQKTKMTEVGFKFKLK